MKVLKTSLSIVLCVGFVVMAATAFAEDDDPQAKLAKECEAKAKETASTKPTVAMITEKVNKAVEMLKAEGVEAGFKKLQGKDSEFIFAGTYIWAHDMKGVMRMHPIKYKLNGKSIQGLKDSSGKLFFGEMNKVARENGSGWVCYMWPKPGEKEASKKVSYVKLCKIGDDELVVGCGVYDLPADDIEKLVGDQ